MINFHTLQAKVTRFLQTKFQKALQTISLVGRPSVVAAIYNPVPVQGLDSSRHNCLSPAHEMIWYSNYDYERTPD